MAAGSSSPAAARDWSGRRCSPADPACPTSRPPVAQLDRLTDLFGRDNVGVELFDRGEPLDSTLNDVLAALAAERGLPIVATGAVHYATPKQHRLGTALAAVRAPGAASTTWTAGCPPPPERICARGAEMAARFARYPGAVEATVDIAADLAFQLRSARPGLPKQEVPDGHTPMSWLRQLVWEAVPRLYPNAPQDTLDRIAARARRDRGRRTSPATS